MANVTLTIVAAPNGKQMSAYRRGNFLDAPTGLTASVSGNTVTLSWTNRNNGVAPTIVQRSSDNGATWASITTKSAGVSSHNDTSLANGNYDYRVQHSLNGFLSAVTSSVDATVSTASDWQLASGHWIPRKRNMTLVHPRPDGETSVYAQHRNSHPGIPWSTRIVIGHGAWPFRCELVDAPAGVTLGEVFVASGDELVAPTYYMEVFWADPEAGTHDFEVNIYDQDYGRGGSPSSALNVQFSHLCGTANHVFIHSTAGNDSGAGTEADPFLTIEKLHADNSATGTYNGKTVWLRGGTHDVDGMSTNGNRYAILSGGAPNVFVGYPGETAILNLYEGHIVLNTGAADTMFKDLTIQCAGDWTADQYMFIVVTATNRHSWHGVTFQNFYGGTSTDANNQAVIWYSNQGCRYVSIVGCHFTGRMGCILDCYNVQDLVFERCSGADLVTGAELNAANSHELLYFKDSCLRFTVRANDFVDGMTGVAHGSFVGCGGQNDGGASHSFNEIEICYNKLADFDIASIRGYYEYGDGPAGSVYGYRNSCLGSITDFVDSHNVGPNPNVWENNVAVGGISGMWNATLTDNTTGGGTLDSNGNLTGATLTNHLGLRGANVA